MADFNLFNMLRTVTQHIQYNVGEVYVIPRRIKNGWSKRSSAPSSQIPMMLYQKVLTGVMLGAVFQ